MHDVCMYMYVLFFQGWPLGIGLPIREAYPWGIISLCLSAFIICLEVEPYEIPLSLLAFLLGMFHF